jgi:hypothetical protein
MISLDISGVDGVKTGDAVELLGDHVTLEEMARLAGTNAYEILTGLRAPRHYTDTSVGESRSDENESAGESRSDENKSVGESRSEREKS